VTKKTTKKKAKKVAKKTTKKKATKKKTKVAKKKSKRKTVTRKKTGGAASATVEAVDEEQEIGFADAIQQEATADRAAVEGKAGRGAKAAKRPSTVGVGAGDDDAGSFGAGFGGGILDEEDIASDSESAASAPKRKSKVATSSRPSTKKTERRSRPARASDDTFFAFDDDDEIGVEEAPAIVEDDEFDDEIEDDVDDTEDAEFIDDDVDDVEYDDDDEGFDNAIDEDDEDEEEPFAIDTDDDGDDFLSGFDFDDEDDDAPKNTRGRSSKPQMGSSTGKDNKRRRSRKERLAEEEEVVEKVAGQRRSKLEDLASGKPSREKTQKSRPTDDDRGEDDRKGRRGRGRRDRDSRSHENDEAAIVDFDEVESLEPAKRKTQQSDERGKRGRGAPKSASKPVPNFAPAGDDEDCQMLINMIDGEECRIAVLKGGRLDELYIERAASSSNVGNIYKGRVTNIEPSIQAAFVDFGQPAHGFLHISDLHPQYFDAERSSDLEMVGKKTPRKQRPPIQSCLKRGQEVIVQVIKEGIGTKGPTLSSYISIPGRFVVMMPGMEQLGVSRKIEDEEQRRKMRDMLGQLSLPKDMGFIVRTAGIDRTKRDLQRDLNYLSRLWKRVDTRIKKVPAPASLYKESDLVIRTIRDVYDSSLKKVIVDSESVGARVSDFLSIASPRSTDVVEIYDGDEPLFHRYGIEKEITQLYSKNVPLPCGGSLVIEQTEAMVAVDVNSGKFRVHEDAEETSFHVNCEAVDELARQLRLRDLGGLVVVDLIDMGLEKNRRAIEKRMSDALKKHKERAKVLRISRFGLLEMTRQRQGPSITRNMYNTCPRCLGSGRLKAPESVAIDAMRRIHIAASQEGVARIDLRTSNSVANDLLNRKRRTLVDMESKRDLEVRIQGVDSFSIDTIEVTAADNRGRDIPLAIATGDQARRQDRGGRTRGGRGRRGGRRSR